MKKIMLLLWKLTLIMCVSTFFSIRTDGRDITIYTTLKSLVNSSFVHSGQAYSTADLADMMKGRITQEPGDSLSKAELRALRREERDERKALARAERQTNRKVIDNPNHADFVLLGEDLPTGRGVLDAISGRVPGMMISSDGYVTTHGPGSFYGGGTPLFLVDEMEVTREYANSVPIEDIERVEVFTGPSSAIYGSRAGVGVISIYTKTSLNNARVDE